VAVTVCSTPGLYWLWADHAGLLVEPATRGRDPDDVEVRTELGA
jgi:hypothetical protein